MPRNQCTPQSGTITYILTSWRNSIGREHLKRRMIRSSREHPAEDHMLVRESSEG
jgi:hypothetical protein